MDKRQSMEQRPISEMCPITKENCIGKNCKFDRYGLCGYIDGLLGFVQSNNTMVGEVMEIKQTMSDFLFSELAEHKKAQKDVAKGLHQLVARVDKIEEKVFGIENGINSILDVLMPKEEEKNEETTNTDNGTCNGADAD